MRWTSQLGGSAKDCTVTTVIFPPYCGVLAVVDVVVVVDAVVDVVTVVDFVVVVDVVAVDVVVIVVVFEQAFSTKDTTNSRLNPTHKNLLFTFFSFIFYFIMILILNSS